MRRVALTLAVLVGLYGVALLVAGLVLGDRIGEQVAARVGEALQSTATVGDSDLALLRGRMQLSQLRVRRADAVGTLALDVGRVDCDLPPLGLALFDSACNELAIDGVRLEVSTFALFRVVRPQRAPVTIQRVRITDTTIAFSPSTLAPGLGAVRISVALAEAGPTTFKSPLSWLFAAEVLRATVELPAGLAVHLDYRAGVLAASGSLFGTTPVRLPVTLPVATLGADARAELEQLAAWSRDVAARLVTQRAEDWLKSKLPL